MNELKGRCRVTRQRGSFRVLPFCFFLWQRHLSALKQCTDLFSFRSSLLKKQARFPSVAKGSSCLRKKRKLLPLLLLSSISSSCWCGVVVAAAAADLNWCKECASVHKQTRFIILWVTFVGFLFLSVSWSCSYFFFLSYQKVKKQKNRLLKVYDCSF